MTITRAKHSLPFATFPLIATGHVIDVRRFRLRHLLLIGWAVVTVSPVWAEDASSLPPNTPAAPNGQPADTPRVRSEGFVLPPRLSNASIKVASTTVTPEPQQAPHPQTRGRDVEPREGLIVSEPPAFPSSSNFSNSRSVQQITRAPAVSVAQAPTSKVPVPSTPAQNTLAQNTPAQKPLVLAPPQPTSTTSDESALPFPSAYAPENKGALPPPQLTVSASGSALTGDPQSGAHQLDDRQSDDEVVSLLSPEYAHLLEPNSAFAPTATRRIADHWTPWWRLKRVDLVPKSLSNLGRLWWQNSGRSHSITGDLGIGHERVMFAPSIIDPAIIPAGASLYLQSDRGLNVPDRAAYYWSPSPVGPGFDPEVNSLDTRLQLAVGNRQAMAITEFSLRSLDPTLAPNTTGFGDMVVGAQALMLDGKRLKLSSIFRTYLSTGPARRGLGTGHTSLEPGLLARFCLSPRTYLFSEVKYWTPLGADPDYAGDVLTLGFAASTIFRESDVYAVLPTLELRTLTFLFGGQTSGLTTPVPPATDNNPILSRYDGRTAVELYPGARIVFGPAGDLGLWELNLAAGVTLAEDHWFDSRVRIGLRWNY